MRNWSWNKFIVDEATIRGSAEGMIRTFGTNAEREFAEMLDRMNLRKDALGVETWEKVFREVRTLENNSGMARARSHCDKQAALQSKNMIP